MSKRPPAWSYSVLDLYDTCPKKFYHLRVAKDYSEPENDILRFGKEFHKAAELFIRRGAPLPDKFSFAEAPMLKLRDMPGEKLCEYKMGLTENLEPCDFFAKDVWFRGVADLIILNREGGTARVIDYKTSKSAAKADTGQLELLALSIFAHFPEIKKVQAGLMFVVCNAFIKETYEAENTHKLWARWLPQYEVIKKAYAVGTWNPRPSGLCRRHCVITECIHNGRNNI